MVSKVAEGISASAIVKVDLMELEREVNKRDSRNGYPVRNCGLVRRENESIAGAEEKILD